MNLHHRIPPAEGMTRIRVCRPSVLGNPFVIGRDGDRDAVCRQYRAWLWDRIKACDANVLDALWAVVDTARCSEGVELACFCVPRRCHSESVAAAARWLDAQTTSRPSRPAPGGRSIFVFGSNEQGRHGKGAALFARTRHGACPGVGVGLQGSCYAIPTKSSPYQALPLGRVASYVEEFLQFACSRPEWRFELTRIGAGHAGEGSATTGRNPGLREADMAALFRESPENVVSIDERGNEIGLARDWAERLLKPSNVS